MKCDDRVGEWDNGEITSDSLSVIEDDEHAAYTLHEKEHNILENPGWQRFKCLAKRQKRLLCLQNQAKLRLHCTAPRHKFG